MMRVISTEKAPGAIGPYSQGVVANGLIYTSGQIPVVPTTGEIPEGIAAQAEPSCRMWERFLRRREAVMRR